MSAGGTIDLLVNNAGIGFLEDFMNISPETFDETIAVNTRAPLLVSQVSKYKGGGDIARNRGRKLPFPTPISPYFLQTQTF